ncbi:MAG: prepilin-type N-terminal cleavage/methylation domain-containing protein [Spartobacteria bacterium]
MSRRPLAAIGRPLAGFTLVELLVSMVIIALMVLFIAQLFDSATRVTTSHDKQADNRAQARPVFDRMALDLGQIVQRSDVSYYFKSPANMQTGNDQIAFYSAVTGYYPSPSYQSPLSLVAYRVNSDPSSAAFNKLERLGKGLHWSGVSTSYTPVVFSPLTVADTWPAATDSTAESDYELIGPQVFRFEYGYLLKSGGWATTVSDFQTVKALLVTVATIDPKTMVLVPDAKLTTLAGEMFDFADTMKGSGLRAQWQLNLNSTSTVPRSVASAIRVYSRLFPVGR